MQRSRHSGSSSPVSGSTWQTRRASRLRIDVADAQGLTGHVGKGTGIAQDALPHTRAALGPLPEEQALLLPLTDQLHGDLVLLHLVDNLDAPLERVD